MVAAVDLAVDARRAARYSTVAGHCVEGERGVRELKPSMLVLAPPVECSAFFFWTVHA
jgi:hypothetical protein